MRAAASGNGARGRSDASLRSSEKPRGRGIHRGPFQPRALQTSEKVRMAIEMAEKQRTMRGWNRGGSGGVEWIEEFMAVDAPRRWIFRQFSGEDG